MKWFPIAVLLLLSGCAERTAPPPPSPPQPEAKHHEPPVMDGSPGAPDIDRPPGGALPVEAVKMVDTERKSHELITFVTERDQAQQALAAHQSKKAEDIGKLDQPRAGKDVGLYLAWGFQPEPTFNADRVSAFIDPESRKIRIEVPAWTTQKPPGTGLDWRNENRSSWTFVGCRAKLATLPAGAYSFEVWEVADGKSRLLVSGVFTLAR